jgi:hypothetical protein
MRTSLLVLIALSGVLRGQDPIQEGAHISEIHTPTAFPSGNPVGYPFIELGSGQQLEFHFDLAGLDRDDLWYTVVHCDHQWFRSDLISNQYLTGFSHLQISDAEPSFGTAEDYVHYTFSFPNDLMMPQISGNYAVIVYSGGDPGDPENWLLVWRTVIFEQKVRMKADVKASSVVRDRFTHHEIRCELFTDFYRIHNPGAEINLTVLSNGEWNKAIHGLKPTFIKPDGIVYEYIDGKSALPGGNEWRDFEMKDIRVSGLGVERVEQYDGEYHVFLRPDAPRGLKGAFDTRNDLNGKFLVRSDMASDSHLEAEYVHVHFSLVMPEVTEGHVHIEGGLSRLSAEPWVMSYNPSRGAYVYEAMVKQGYYNYRYAIYDLYHPAGDTGLTEGNFSGTENDYQVLVYHRDRVLGTDRVVGFHALRSNR